MKGRRARVLVEVVDRYIRTRRPVSSQELIQAYHHRWSSATLRNELHALEEEGYLFKPHASSGRVPTVRGFRFFAQWLLAVAQETPQPASLPVEPQSAPGLPPLPALLRRTAFLLASITGELGFVVAPRPEELQCLGVVLREVQPGTLLVAIVSKYGLVETHVLPGPTDLKPEELQETEGWLARWVSEKPEKVPVPGPWEGRAVHLAHRLFQEIRETASSRVFVEGWPQLLGELAVRSPEWALGKMQAVFHLFRDEEAFVSLLEELRADQPGLMAHVGVEQVPELHDLSLVTSPYSAQGIVGVVGPLWMNYARVFSTVRYLAGRLQSFLREGGGA